MLTNSLAWWAARHFPGASTTPGRNVRSAGAAHLLAERIDDQLPLPQRYRGLMMLDDRFMLMSPMGSLSRRGNQYTESEWAEIGRFFRNGRESTFDLIHAYRGADVVVLVALEHTHVQVGPVPAQPWALRVTLVFRKKVDRCDPRGVANIQDAAATRSQTAQRCETLSGHAHPVRLQSAPRSRQPHAAAGQSRAQRRA
jgi:hypothetical protein